jgi:hypothetical protein
VAHRVHRVDLGLGEKRPPGSRHDEPGRGIQPGWEASRAEVGRRAVAIDGISTASRDSSPARPAVVTSSGGRSGTWPSHRGSRSTPSPWPPGGSRTATTCWPPRASGGSGTRQPSGSRRIATSAASRRRWRLWTPKRPRRSSVRRASRRRPRRARTSSRCRSCGRRPRTPGGTRSRRPRSSASTCSGPGTYTFTLTAAAKARGWDAAFGAGVVRVEGQCGRGNTPSPNPASGEGVLSAKEVQSGRGERDCPATSDLPIVMRLAEPPEPCDWLRSA